MVCLRRYTGRGGAWKNSKRASSNYADLKRTALGNIIELERRLQERAAGVSQLSPPKPAQATPLSEMPTERAA